MPEKDGRNESRRMGDYGIIPRHIARDRTFRFGLGTGDGLVVPVKTSAGNPASPEEGQIYVNTSANAVRVYADGAWRDLATW